MASNHSSFGSDMLANACLKTEIETSKIMLADKHAAEWAIIDARIKADPNAKVRGVLLEAWKATPAGETFYQEYDSLKEDGKDTRSPNAEARFVAMGGQLTSLNTSLSRTLDTYRGIAALREAGCKVTVRKLKIEGNAWGCFVQREGEDEATPFNASKLQLAYANRDKLTPEMTSRDMRKACATAKQGTRNEETPANGVVEPSLVKDQAIALDTAIAKLLKADGTVAGGKGVNEAIAFLYARMHTCLSDKLKRNALKHFEREGTGEPVDVKDVA